MKDKDKVIVDLNEKLKESKACEIKDSGIAYYKEKLLVIEKVKNALIESKQKELDALWRDWNRQSDDLFAYKQVN